MSSITSVESKVVQPVKSVDYFTAVPNDVQGKIFSFVGIDKGFSSLYLSSKSIQIQMNHFHLFELFKTFTEFKVNTLSRYPYLLVSNLTCHNLGTLCLEDRTEWNDDLEKILFRAARAGNLEVINRFIHKFGSDIPQNARGFAIRWSTKYNHKEITTSLLSLGPIKPKDLDFCLELAAENGCIDILNIFLAFEGISPESRGDALCLAANEGKEDCVIAILNSGPIPLEKIQLSFEWAIDSFYTNIAYILLQYDLTN